MNSLFAKKASFGNSQSGQIGLIIILIMVVILTIGLSVASRSTDDLEITSQSETSTRVFNAAESEIENALSAIYKYENEGVALTNPPESISDEGVKSKYSINLTDSLETNLIQGRSAEIRLVGATSGNINIRWSRESCANNPASLLISVYFDNGGPGLEDIRARHYGVTINDCDNQRDDSLELADATVFLPYNGSYNLAVTDLDRMIRITPLYNNTDILIPANALISHAQYNINSRAQSDAENKETNAINVRRTIPSAPSFMDFTLVSGEDIDK
jgi:Tfp pilus assembly protein PilX